MNCEHHLIQAMTMWWRAIAHTAHLLAHFLACAAEPGCGLDWTHILGEQPIFFLCKGSPVWGAKKGDEQQKLHPFAHK